MGYVTVRCASDVSSRLFFDKLAHLFVDLPAAKAILNGIQADLSCMPFSQRTLNTICNKASPLRSPDDLLQEATSQFFF